MTNCITCGTRLHPERAEKYNYCLAPACQAENAKPLTMVAVGVNKSAEQYEVLDERTRQAMADGGYHDQRRASFGKGQTPTPAGSPPQGAIPAARTPSPRRPQPRTPTRRPWTKKQENLVLIYHEQGLRPQEIAAKVRLSRYTVTQIILGARRPPRR